MKEISNKQLNNGRRWGEDTTALDGVVGEGSVKSEHLS